MSRIKQDLQAYHTGLDGAAPTPDEEARSGSKSLEGIHVGIVGAGFAGLRCADVLLQHGIKVSIIEARDRLGGRIGQSNHLGHLVDLGANWIHGTNDNPIMKLAKETKTGLHAWDEEQAVFDTDGNIMDAAEAEEYTRLLWDDGLIAEAFKYSNEHRDSIDPKKSLRDFFVERSGALFQEDSPQEAQRKRETLIHVAAMWGAYVGSPISRQSLRFFWLEEVIEGENPFVAETYEKILGEVSRNARENADIKLNSVVTSINSHESNSDASAPSINIADGTTIEFDELVVTTPLGWLKNNGHAFKPALPPRLTQAISSISYGCLDKVYITFPSAFWDVPLPGRQTVSNDLDPAGKTPNVSAKTAPLHQSSTDTEDASHFPGFTHWLSPSYATDSNPEQFGQECMNLAAMSGGLGHPTLLFYIYGPCSRHIASLVSSSANDTERDLRLRSFFEPYYSRLPNFDSSDAKCTPTGFLATAWANDEFAGYGSYSNFQVGLEQGDKDIEVMRHGMPERRIWLAGEHTAPLIALGTSTGAYWSGEGVAKRIVKAYSRK